MSTCCLVKLLFDFSQEEICKNYHGIRLKPDHFSSYLTAEVGFSSYELIGTPQNDSRGQSFEMPCNSHLWYCAIYLNIYFFSFLFFPLGFQRPIYIFHKGPSPQKWHHQSWPPTLTLKSTNLKNLKTTSILKTSQWNFKHFLWNWDETFNILNS